MERDILDLAFFNPAIDRATVRPKMTGRPVEFELTEQTREAIDAYLKKSGLDPALYGTHEPRRTKATLIYKRTGNLRAVQLLLGQTKIKSTVRGLGIDVDDALEIDESVEV